MLIYAFACTRMSQVSGRATRSLARVSVLGRAHALPLGAAVLKEVLFQCVCVCVFECGTKKGFAPPRLWQAVREVKHTTGNKQ
jgi:hypothetical protein